VQVWWVNQNQTFNHERQGGYLWAPKRNANGAKNANYEFLTRVEPGDLIFSFVNSQIVAVAKAEASAITSPKPDFGGAGLNWQNDGWRIDVLYSDLKKPVRPKDHIKQIAPKLDLKYSPLNQAGNGIQAYFFPVGPGLLEELKKILEGQFESAAEQLFANALSVDIAPNFDDPESLVEESKIQHRNDIGETQRLALVMARRGQGVFRSNVRLVEHNCRVTGVAESGHLIASHIKPWSKSDDSEKLDGHNGLLLAPHIDHLFDKGFISFTNQGVLLASRHLSDDISNKWHLDRNQHVGSFSIEQSRYLEFHRDEIYERKFQISK
jgi:putative restriction endonuclease